MTGEQIIRAHIALEEFASVTFPYKVARSIALLRRRLEEERKIVFEIEKKTVEKHGGILKGNAYKFADSESAKECARELEKLKNEDVEISLPLVDLTDFVDAICLSPSALDALEGIILFEKEG